MASLRGHKIETNLQSTSRGGGGHQKKKTDHVTNVDVPNPPFGGIELKNGPLAFIEMYTV